jgi:hypothetical protein
MGKTVYRLLMTEITKISNQIDVYKANSKMTSKIVSEDEVEFYKFMTSILEDSLSKIQKKLDKDKQTNKKLKFISHDVV